MHLTYSILYFFAFLFLFPFEYLKRPKELRKRWLRERLGSLPSVSKTVWIHAVSVGEVIASVPLIEKLREKYPSAGVVVSTVTDTGQKVARERLGNNADIIYAPFDLPFAVKKSVKHIMPSVFIIMETELWPNIIATLGRRNIPVLLMNGRISEKSFKGYRKLKFFMKDVLGSISLFCMQNSAYAQRIKLLGADAGRVKITGSFKFDTKPPGAVPGWTGILKGPVIIAGSTHRGEEALMLDAYSKLKNDFERLNLIVAPRHPERFREVEELLKRKGLQYIKRSELKSGNELSAESSGFARCPSPAVIILDVMGELSSVYGASGIAVMGGSFIEHGGQNPLEPAYWGKAVVCGPHMENFPFIEEFYSSGGAVKTEPAGLYGTLKELLSAPVKVSSMGKTARELYLKNSGAAEKAARIIGEYL